MKCCVVESNSDTKEQLIRSEQISCAYVIELLRGMFIKFQPLVKLTDMFINGFMTYNLKLTVLIYSPSLILTVMLYLPSIGFSHMPLVFSG